MTDAATTQGAGKTGSDIPTSSARPKLFWVTAQSSRGIARSADSGMIENVIMHEIKLGLP
jgi:hypothetical protein